MTVPDVRALERMLHASGLSRREAKVIASAGLRALAAPPPASMPPEAVGEALQLMEQLRAVLGRG